METKTNSFSSKAHNGHHRNKLQKPLIIANESASMASTSASISFATLIVHPSLSGILLMANPLSVQPLKELYAILNAVS
jgi:membrane-bound ClpP family serine protease